jgi:hypothetical protein
VNPSMGAWAADGRPRPPASHSPAGAELTPAASIAVFSGRGFRFLILVPHLKREQGGSYRTVRGLEGLPRFIGYTERAKRPAKDPKCPGRHAKVEVSVVRSGYAGLCEAGSRAQAPMDGFTACPAGAELRPDAG